MSSAVANRHHFVENFFRCQLVQAQALEISTLSVDLSIVNVESAKMICCMLEDIANVYLDIADHIREADHANPQPWSCSSAAVAQQHQQRPDPVDEPY